METLITIVITFICIPYHEKEYQITKLDKHLTICEVDIKMPRRIAMKFMVYIFLKYYKECGDDMIAWGWRKR